MKNFKKLMALVIAGVMMVAAIPATAAVDNLDHKGVLTVNGLNSGTNETVKYFKVLEWDQDNATPENGGWKYTTQFAGATNASTIFTNILAGTINGDDAANLAACVSASDTGITSPAGSISGKTWTAGTEQAPVDPGLYLVFITTDEPGVFYNPVFVASNWYNAGGPGTEPTEQTFDIVKDALSYSDEAYAKLSTITLDKTATGNTTDSGQPAADSDPNTTDVGDIIDFTVKTKIPVYNDSYTNPVFKVKDTLEGLTLDQTSIVVYGANAATAGKELVKDRDYTIDEIGTDKYTISFTKAYMQSDTFPQAGQDITITYKAEVSDAALKTVNQDKNTVDLIFSTNPLDTTGAGRLRDKTNHFNFSIDADILGRTGESSQELIKVGVSADGTPIEEVISDYAYQAEHAALEGAEFTLYKEDGVTIYKNDVFDGTKIVSDDHGRLNIKGLDAGTYVLKETKAPNGYIKWQNDVTITIDAVVKTDKTIVEEVDGVECTYITNYLESYSVEFSDGSGTTSTSYTIINDSVGTSDTAKEVTRTGGDEEIKNTKGTELPSTGGMGTTLFYAIGAILVLGAGILLVSKRRMSAN